MPDSTAFGRSADADRLINLDFSRDTQRPDASTEGAPLREFSSSVESRRSHERTYSQQSQGGSVSGLRHVAAEHRVGYIAVPLPAGATSSASHAPPMTLSNAEGSPAAAARRPRVTIRSPPQTDDAPPTCMLPPLRDGYEYQPIHIVTRDIDLPRVIEDPSAYRPATPILNWEGPKRSLKPPKMQFWLCVTFICVITNVVSGVVPLRLNNKDNQAFIIVWIACSALFTATFTYMSTTRHLHNVTIQMQGIHNPSDIDVVLEKLEGGRFSRFEEVWGVQVHMIKMFCRLLRSHHGVPASTGNGGTARTRHGMRMHPSGYDQTPEYSENDEHPLSDNAYDEGNEHDLMTAVSEEFTPEPTPRAAPTDGGSRGHKGDSLTSFPSSPAGAIATGTIVARRAKLTNADPLNDNAKSWDEVLSAGDDSEGPSRSLFLQLLKQVRVGQDLSKIALPVHILEPRSLLEKISDLFIQPELVGAFANAADAVDRVTRISRWFLSAYRMRPKGVKKPYNPVLGETFECVFARGKADELWFFAEQVSHHPPISCFRAVHRASNVEVVGSYVPRSKLMTPNTGASIGEGFIDVYIPQSNDTYRLGWPTVLAVGVLKAPLRIELTGCVSVTPRSANEPRGELHFEQEGYFSGERDVVRGGIYMGGAKTPAFVIKGKWHSTTTVQTRTAAVNVKKDAATDGEPVVFFEPAIHEPLRPEALHTAFPKPSRQVWKAVTIALRACDADAAQKAKVVIESHEREIRRAREARGEEYVPGFFRIVGEVKGTGKDTWRYVGPQGFDSPATGNLNPRRASHSSQDTPPPFQPARRRSSTQQSPAVEDV
jgi:hypothetical protein